MFKNFFPNKILSLSNNFFSNLIIVFIIIVFVGLIYALFISPPDYIQGDSVRIMYVHVPSSLLALFCFGFLGVSSILTLIFKIKILPIMARSLAPVGLIFCSVSIVTGSLWGKPTWGIWWVWDARLTSMFVLLISYVLYLSSWKFIVDFEKANKISSIIAIVGSLNLPVIKFSVDWWNTLHQTSSISLTSLPKIHHTMLFPLIIMFVAMVIYTLIIFLMKYKTEIIKFKIKNKKNNK
jgi:heme exporter protein C